jgi:hypothetical protein
MLEVSRRGRVPVVFNRETEGLDRGGITMYLTSGRGSKVSSDKPASKGNQKYMCSSLSVKHRPLRAFKARVGDNLTAGDEAITAASSGADTVCITFA